MIDRQTHCRLRRAFLRTSCTTFVTAVLFHSDAYGREVYLEGTGHVRDVENFYSSGAQFQRRPAWNYDGLHISILKADTEQRGAVPGLWSFYPHFIEIRASNDFPPHFGAGRGCDPLADDPNRKAGLVPDVGARGQKYDGAIYAEDDRYALYAAAECDPPTAYTEGTFILQTIEECSRDCNRISLEANDLPVGPNEKYLSDPWMVPGKNGSAGLLIVRSSESPEDGTGASSIWAVDADQTGMPIRDAGHVRAIRLAQLDSGTLVRSARVSPDRHRLSFVHVVDTHDADLLLVNDVEDVLSGDAGPVTSLADARIVAVDDGPTWCESPTWSQDSTLLIYSCDDTGNFDSTDVVASYDESRFELTALDVSSLDSPPRKQWLLPPGLQGPDSNSIDPALSHGGPRLVWIDHLGPAGPYAFETYLDGAPLIVSETLEVDATGHVTSDFLLQDGGGSRLHVAAGTLVGTTATFTDLTVSSDGTHVLINPVEGGCTSGTYGPVSQILTGIQPGSFGCPFLPGDPIELSGAGPYDGPYVFADAAPPGGCGILLSPDPGPVPDQGTYGPDIPVTLSVPWIRDSSIFVLSPIVLPYEDLGVGVDRVPVVREFGPNHTTFSPPAEVTLAYLDSEIRAMDESSLRVYKQSPATSLFEIEIPLVGRNPDDNTITALLPGFSAAAAGGKIKSRQSSAQNKCLKTIYGLHAKSAKNQLKADVLCRFYASVSSSYDEDDFENCFSASSNSRVIDEWDESCLGPSTPDFAAFKPDSDSPSPVTELAAAMPRLFGDPMVPSIAASGTPLDKCQNAVLRSVTKALGYGYSARTSCIVKGLADGTIDSPTALIGTCLAGTGIADAIATRAQKLSEIVEKKCTSLGVPLQQAFPGDCAGAIDESSAISCLSSMIQNVTCRAVAVVATGSVSSCDP